ncbi:HIT domain-containing protein [Longispora sp. K20-0274]|uniref:HIT family protein n=1 Tax=Longispora sp. K20-0274 TaxID=3088255 RepID=UPI00399B0298
MTDCVFCLPLVEPYVVLSDEHCYTTFTHDTGTPAGSAMILPRAHRPTVFDLTPDEWASTRTLLHRMRALITELHGPDGWNVGWNTQPTGGQSIPHAHCHLVPRYHDEPLAGRGIRSWIKDPDNRPPHHAPADPAAWYGN